MHEHDAVGRVHVEGLRLFFAGCRALRRVAHMAEADVAEERPHVARAERLAHLPLRLGDVEDAVALGGRDAGRVLPAMLQQQERVVDLLVDRAAARPSRRFRTWGVTSLRPRSLSSMADEAHRPAVDALRALLEVARRARSPLAHDADLPGRDAVLRESGCRGIRLLGGDDREEADAEVPGALGRARGRGRRGRRARGTPAAATRSTGRPRPTASCGSTRARLAAMPPPVTWLSACTPSPVLGDEAQQRLRCTGGSARAAPRPTSCRSRRRCRRTGCRRA